MTIKDFYLNVFQPVILYELRNYFLYRSNCPLDIYFDEKSCFGYLFLFEEGNPYKFLYFRFLNEKLESSSYEKDNFCFFKYESIYVPQFVFDLSTRSVVRLKDLDCLYGIHYFDEVVLEEKQKNFKKFLLKSFGLYKDFNKYVNDYKVLLMGEDVF